MEKHHYVVIKNRLRLVMSKLQTRKWRSRKVLCRNCFHRCSSPERLVRHQLVCMGNEPTIFTMPDSSKSRVHFKNGGARSYSPFVVYFDLEFKLEKVLTVKNPNDSSTAVIEKHQPSSFCHVVIQKDISQPALSSLQNGQMSWQNFFTC